ncbi:hypothetical protein GCM10009733_080260 [Nonomuraea maheshkhaliensis]|uniref:Uncharacterized protein n=1 Tax=Nonomuraea maheshkhaliensis TaxID=419590 RepID=A0ABP4SKB4_9ACTN
MAARTIRSLLKGVSAGRLGGSGRSQTSAGSPSPVARPAVIAPRSSMYAFSGVQVNGINITPARPIQCIEQYSVSRRVAVVDVESVLVTEGLPGGGAVVELAGLP